MKRYLFSIFALLSALSFGDSGPYLGGGVSLDYRNAHFKDLSALSSIYDKYSSKLNYGLIVGYDLPLPVFSIAAEFGMDFKASDINFHNYNGTTWFGREVEISKMKYIDLLPGFSLFMDSLLFNVIVGMERSSLKLKESFLTNQAEISKHRKAKRLGAAISFCPPSSFLALRLSIVRSTYESTVYSFPWGSGEIKPQVVRAALALILKI